MLLRPRQQEFVERSLGALAIHGNTLGVAPTGAGKTIMLSAVAGGLIKDGADKICILAHRDELTAQNRDKFERVNPGIITSIVDASEKDWSGRATFAMVPTLARPANLDAMPALDLLIVDEAHHTAADSYRRVIDKAKSLNPSVKLFGVTATPNRGDRKGLREIFDNVADQIEIGELIASGHLVPPRTFIVDVGAQDQLRQVKKTVSDYDMDAVASIMDTVPINNAVIKHWKEKAGDRKTVVFCSTINHARSVQQAFLEDGVEAVLVTGELNDTERAEALAAFEKGSARVIVNVAVLTEGWDYQPTSCVVLLRPSSYKCTMIQMVGRGLRTVDPALYPGIIKTDCIVLDFGTSSLMHGTLETDVQLDCKKTTGATPTKDCPKCEGVVPLGVHECPFCNYVWGNADKGALTDFVMTEVDLLNGSPFLWCNLFGDDHSLIAQGFEAWAGVFFFDGRWHALGGGKNMPPALLRVGERLVCLAAANDWLNTYETDDTAHKSKGWTRQPATDKQLQYLPPQYRTDYSLTRYHASALMTFQFNRAAIRHLVFDASKELEAA